MGVHQPVVHPAMKGAKVNVGCVAIKSIILPLFLCPPAGTQSQGVSKKIVGPWDNTAFADVWIANSAWDYEIQHLSSNWQSLMAGFFMASCCADAYVWADQPRMH